MVPDHQRPARQTLGGDSHEGLQHMTKIARGLQSGILVDWFGWFVGGLLDLVGSLGWLVSSVELITYSRVGLIGLG